MGKQTKNILLTPVIVFSILLLLSSACDDDPKITTRCDLTAQLVFVNNGTDSLDIDLVDSTEWISLAHLESQESFLPESTISIADSSVVIDTARILWSFEHEDIYDTGVVCSAKIDLQIMAIISKNDSIIAIEDLGLCCSETELDTAYTDSTGIEVAEFYRSVTIFLPQ